MAGYVRRIDLQAGDAVAARQVLAVIEPARSVALDPRTRAQAQAQVSAAQAALAAAQANARAAAAAATWRSRSAPVPNPCGNRISFPRRRSTARARQRPAPAPPQAAAQHAVRVARFDLETARAAVASTAGLQAGGAAELVQVRAPVAAHVLKLLHESEGAVAAGQPLLEIGDPASLEVEVEVLSTHAVKIAPGSKVILDRWGGEQSVEGTVRVVEPSGFTKISALGVEEQRVRVIVDFSSPREAWARLGDGYRVEARFVLWEGAGRAAAADQRAVPAGRRLGGVRAGRPPRAPDAGRNRPARRPRDAGDVRAQGRRPGGGAPGRNDQGRRAGEAALTLKPQPVRPA